MHVRNHPGGYGSVTKLLHWLTVAALAAQFTVGYSIERFDDLLAPLVDRFFDGEEGYLLVIHAVLGVSILALTTVRLFWRSVGSLPPWAEGLSDLERRIAHHTERSLYWLLFAIPLTGLVLLFASGEKWEIGERKWEAPAELVDNDLVLVAHIAAHVAFFAALSVHVGLVLKHQLVDRDRLLNRML